MRPQGPLQAPPAADLTCTGSEHIITVTVIQLAVTVHHSITVTTSLSCTGSEDVRPDNSLYSRPLQPPSTAALYRRSRVHGTRTGGGGRTVLPSFAPASLAERRPTSTHPTPPNTPALSRTGSLHTRARAHTHTHTAGSPGCAPSSTWTCCPSSSSRSPVRGRERERERERKRGRERGRERERERERERGAHAEACRRELADSHRRPLRDRQLW